MVGAQHEQGVTEGARTAKETTREKGQRPNAEGRVERVSDTKYVVHGDTGNCVVEKGRVFWSCPCARKGDCGHVEAVHAARLEELGSGKLAFDGFAF